MLERLARGEPAVVHLDYHDEARPRAAHVPADRSWPHEPASLASGQRLRLEASWLLPLVVPLGHALRVGVVLLLAVVVARPIGEHTVDLLGTVSQALHQVTSHTHP
jgi:hypothetical protein